MKHTTMIDWISLKLYGATMLGGIFLKLTMMPVFGWITAFAGITTIIYNLIKIVKELKNKP